MSKKQDRSNRKSDIPDWADEVTPADEVMEKFYAPTGVFRSGPISSTRESAEISPPFQIEIGKHTADSQLPTDSEIDPVNTPHISAEETVETYPQEVAHRASATLGTISTRPPNKRPEGSAPQPQPQAETTLNQEAGISADSALSNSENILFAEFANRWKRYLYPGQLAVMRALYDLTFPHGTSECFTRYSELAASTKMSRRNCINVMNSLVERGFVERLEIRNDATAKGIRLRVHPEPL
jgi:DNA-binding MarR family transcriptional regulator